MAGPPVEALPSEDAGGPADAAGDAGDEDGESARDGSNPVEEQPGADAARAAEGEAPDARTGAELAGGAAGRAAAGERLAREVAPADVAGGPEARGGGGGGDPVVGEEAGAEGEPRPCPPAADAKLEEPSGPRPAADAIGPPAPGGQEAAGGGVAAATAAAAPALVGGKPKSPRTPRKVVSFQDTEEHPWGAPQTPSAAGEAAESKAPVRAARHANHNGWAQEAPAALAAADRLLWLADAVLAGLACFLLAQPIFAACGARSQVCLQVSRLLTLGYVFAFSFFAVKVRKCHGVRPVDFDELSALLTHTVALADKRGKRVWVPIRKQLVKLWKAVQAFQERFREVKPATDKQAPLSQQTAPTVERKPAGVYAHDFRPEAPPATPRPDGQVPLCAADARGDNPNVASGPMGVADAGAREPESWPAPRAGCFSCCTARR